MTYGRMQGMRPAIDKGISMVEKYGLSTIDFLQNELGNGD